jgi:hypothetical protein
MPLLNGLFIASPLEITTLPYVPESLERFSFNKSAGICSFGESGQPTSHDLFNSGSVLNKWMFYLKLIYKWDKQLLLFNSALLCSKRNEIGAFFKS